MYIKKSIVRKKALEDLKKEQERLAIEKYAGAHDVVKLSQIAEKFDKDESEFEAESLKILIKQFL